MLVEQMAQWSRSRGAQTHEPYVGDWVHISPAFGSHLQKATVAGIANCRPFSKRCVPGFICKYSYYEAEAEYICMMTVLSSTAPCMT